MIAFLIRWANRRSLKRQFEIDMERLRVKGRVYGATITRTYEVKLSHCIRCGNEGGERCIVCGQVASLKEEVKMLCDLFEHQCRYL